MAARFTPASATFWIITALALGPAVANIWGAAVNYDIAWIVLAAQKLAQGGTFLRDVYDPNLPLAFIIHFPPAVLALITSLPVYHLTTAYFFLVLAGSAAAFHALLRQWPGYPAHDARILTAAYLTACLVLPSTDFGERDHLIVMGLFPFLLAQLGITSGLVHSRRLLQIVMATGTILVLVKPHYGILPAALIAHRVWTRKNILRLCGDPDFIWLAAGSGIYATLLLTVFRDYTFHILPDILDLYITRTNRLDALGNALFWGTLSGMCMLAAGLGPLNSRARKTALLLLGGGLLCLIPYVVQGKDYWYQIVPCLIFLLCGFVMTVQEWLARLPLPSQGLSSALSLAGLGTAVVLAYVLMPLNTAYPRHADYKNFQITRMVSECGPDCRFFLFDDSIALISPTSIYSQKEHSSRFASLWFLPGLLNTPENDPRREKYKKLVGEDFARYKPNIVLIGRFALQEENAEPFDFISFFDDDPAFRREWSAFKKEKTLEINRRIYHTGSALDRDDKAVYDVYRRR